MRLRLRPRPPSVSAQLLFSSFLAIGLSAAPAFAQGTSVITGTVTDAATGKPIEDVVVTARAPTLQGEQMVVTDAKGLFRVPQLPPGTYALTLEKESYKPFKRGEIGVRVDRTVRVNIQLQPEAIQGDTVVVVGKPPTVDVGSTNTGVSVGKDFIDSVAFIQPNASGVRSFESLAAVAPQVINDDFGFGFSGAQSPENLYVVDGVSVNNAANGTNAGQFPVEFVEEANVITGGYMAEFGRATGGVVNVVTKSGSNEFRGSVWGNWTPGALAGTSKEVTNDVTVFTSKRHLWNSGDLGAEIGGPVIKDKLWFFAGFSPSWSRTQVTRNLRRFLLNDDGTDFLYDDAGFIRSETLAGGRKTAFVDTRAFSYMAKLTYLFNADHNIALSVIGSPGSSSAPLSAQLLSRRSGRNLETADTTSVSAKYTGSFFEKKVLVDASLGWFRVESSSLPSDGSKLDYEPLVGASGTPAVTFRRFENRPGFPAAPPHPISAFEDLADPSLCEASNFRASTQVRYRGSNRFVLSCPATGPGANVTLGGFGFMSAAVIDRLQGKATVTYLARALGHHVLKAGIDLEHLTYDSTKAYSGGVVLRENTTGSRFDDYRQYGVVTAPDVATTQKKVRSVSTGTSVGAFAQDSWNIMDLVTFNAGLRYETQQLFGADGRLGLTLNNMFSPRLGLIYDFTQQGRSKLFANYAKFYEAVPMTIADRSLTGENQVSFRRYRAAGAADQGGPGCDPRSDISQTLNECQDPRNYNYLNASTNPHYVNGAANLTGAGKVPVDPGLQPQSSSEVVVGGEYEVVPDGRAGLLYTKRWMDSVIEDMSNDEGSSYFIGNPGYGLAKAFPPAKRDYDAVTASFTKAFADGWMGQVSYTWSYLRGNYAGLFRPETGQLDPNINSDFDLVSLLANRDGRLDGDREHAFKAYGSKVFTLTGSLAIVLGVTYESRSGAPINYFGAHPLYGEDEAFVLPRGTGGRLPWRHVFNGKVGVNYKITKDNTLSFTTDVFNMLNFQAVTGVDQTFTSLDALPLVPRPGQNPQEAACIGGTLSPQCQEFLRNGTLPVQVKVTDENGENPQIVNMSVSDVNPNFKRPTAYQAPISVRFGLKLTF